MNKETFFKELSNLNINVSKEQLKKLDIYYNFLVEYNSHTNLTSIIDEDLVYLKHFYDSLTITKVIDLNKYDTLLDIGTGAGFPGMVLKIFSPHLKITLLDSNNKKTTFLEHLTKKLELNNITIINKRSEDYIKETRESFDLVTSRAVANLNILLELSIPFLKVNGYFIPLKGDATKEINESKQAFRKLNACLEEVCKFTLPIENSNRNIILIKKIKPTSTIYPRSYNQILKKPLK